MLLLIELPQAEAGMWKGTAGNAGSPSTASTSAVSAYSFTSLIFSVRQAKHKLSSHRSGCVIFAGRTSFFQSIVYMIYIRPMNLAALDLNLLVALDALLLEANVSRAAMRIGLSQPAASHALQRLRDVLGDPLLVRTGSRMELTPRAQALRGPLAQALDQVRLLFIPDDFDAVSSERQFRLMMPDLAVELLMPPLMEKITKAAPNVRIDVVPWRGSAIFTAEFARTIDLVISIGKAFKGFHRQLLYTDRDALAVRRGHAIGAKLKRRDVFLDARHVAVVIRGQSEDLIDGWLRSKGIERRIALVVPGYIEALHVAARTDLVAFVPQRLIRALSKQLSLVSVTPPFDPGIDEQFMFYPTRAQMDPGSIWLRKLMLETGRGLDRDRRKAA
jgi:DNA-binding transcriptional LysR family regulator